MRPFPMTGSSSGFRRAGSGSLPRSPRSWRSSHPRRQATSRAPSTPSMVDGPPAKDRHSGETRSGEPGISRFRVCASRIPESQRWMCLKSKGLNTNRPSLMPVTLDPDAAAVFKAFQESGRPPYETVSPNEARALYLKGRVVSNPEPPELEKVTPLAIPAPHGSIPTRIYTPKTLRKADGLAPVLVFFHGGGWVIGDLDSHDVVCRKLALEGELMVVSVDYRLAPEHKFPAAVDDAITTTKWIAQNAG